MKIGFYSHTPLEYYGGGEVTEISLANWLAEQGWEVHLWAEAAFRGPRRLSPEEVRSRLQPTITYGAMPFLDRKWSGWPYLYASTLPSFEALAENDANLMLLPTVPDRAFLLELSRRRIPMMFLLHSLTLDRSYPLRRQIVFQQLLHRSTLLGLRGLPPAPGLLYQVLNARSASALEARGIPSERVRLIPTGIDFTDYRVGPPSGAFRVVFLGRMEEPSKGLGLLRRAVRAARRRASGPMEFVLIGSGPEGPRMARWASQQPGVDYRGFVTEAEKRACLGSAGLMLSTSATEPYGLSSIEGLASGLPILATSTAGSEYILGSDPSFGGLLPFSAEAFGRAIETHRRAWAESPDGLQSERVRRRAAARRLFDRDLMFERYASALRTMVESRTGTGAAGGSERPAARALPESGAVGAAGAADGVAAG